MCGVIFYTTLSETAYCKENCARYEQQCMFFFMYSTGDCCPILMKVGLSRQIFQKNIQISNFIKMPVLGAEIFHADRRADMKNLFAICRNA